VQGVDLLNDRNRRKDFGVYSPKTLDPRDYLAKGEKRKKNRNSIRNKVGPASMPFFLLHFVLKGNKKTHDPASPRGKGIHWGSQDEL